MKGISGNIGSQHGVGMIETLIATLVVALGIVGYLGLLNTGLKNTDSAAYRNQAAILAVDIIERARAHSTAALSGSYNISHGTAAPSASDPITTDLNQWRTAVTSALPASTSAMNCVGTTQTCTASIRWDDSRGTGGSGTQEITLSTVLR